MSEDDINKECDSILDDYVNKHFGGSQKNTPRFMYRFNKIRENVHFLVLHIIEELKNSGFEPVDCELKIDGDIPGYEVVLPTGQKILLRGSVDRVDILKKARKIISELLTIKQVQRNLNCLIFCTDLICKCLSIFMPLRLAVKSVTVRLLLQEYSICLPP